MGKCISKCRPTRVPRNALQTRILNGIVEIDEAIGSEVPTHDKHNVEKEVGKSRFPKNLYDVQRLDVFAKKFDRIKDAISVTGDGDISKTKHVEPPGDENIIFIRNEDMDASNSCETEPQTELNDTRGNDNINAGNGRNIGELRSADANMKKNGDSETHDNLDITVRKNEDIDLRKETEMGSPNSSSIDMQHNGDPEAQKDRNLYTSKHGAVDIGKKRDIDEKKNIDVNSRKKRDIDTSRHEYGDLQELKDRNQSNSGNINAMRNKNLNAIEARDINTEKSLESTLHIKIGGDLESNARKYNIPRDKWKIGFRDTKNKEINMCLDENEVAEGKNQRNLHLRNSEIDELLIKNGTAIRVTPKMVEELLTHTKHYARFGIKSTAPQNNYVEKDCVFVGSSDMESLNASNVGHICRKGYKKETPNQDNYFIIKCTNWSMYGVFDGHGPYGEEISHFVCTTLAYLLISDEKFETDIESAIKDAFIYTNKLLRCRTGGSRIDSSLSGTTATIVLHRNDVLCIGHVGDSRAILVSKENEGIKCKDLTVDHKSNIESEKCRIINAGGAVKRLEGDVPERVFVKGRLYPGLAMTRAIGDVIGSTVGIIATPDVSIIPLNTDDELIVMCSDGVWEFMSSTDIQSMLCDPHHTLLDYAENIGKKAWDLWIEEEHNVVDDITCLIAKVK